VVTPTTPHPLLFKRLSGGLVSHRYDQKENKERGKKGGEGGKEGRLPSLICASV